MLRILKFLRQVVVLLAVFSLCVSCRGFLPPLATSPWELIPLPTDATVLDVSFGLDGQHGWLVGTESTLLETSDGGRTWQNRPLELGEGEYRFRFNGVSFAGDEGWVVGEPAILLHTTDGGAQWSRIPLSEKLPGVPLVITALGTGAAEMTTNVGAIYQTVDGGQTWQAQVQEAVGVLRSISRSSDGKYVAVSSRGNFFSLWKPGQTSWDPHNRTSSRRLENMGFGPDDQLWLLARGGQVQFGDFADPDTWGDSIDPEFATSWGLLDLTYRTEAEIWVTGGSGNLLCSLDGGATWQKDRTVENIPANFYRVTFVHPDLGFVLGNGGTLLRYNPGGQIT